MQRSVDLAEHLDAQAEAIIDLWRQTVERHGDVPGAEGLSHTDFVDHIPELLDRLADRLRGRSPDLLNDAQKHGRVRWRQGYDAAAVVAEMGHLRTALIRATFAHAREHDYDLPSLESAWGVINGVLNEVTSESVAQFQEESRALAEAVRDESVRRDRELVRERQSAEVERLKLSAVLSSLPVGVWVIDAAGQVVAVNREAERIDSLPAGLAGPARGAAIGLPGARRVRQLDGKPYPPNRLPLARALRGEVVSQEELVWEASGRRWFVNVNAAPLRDPEGAIVGAVAVAQDVTERMHTEERLRTQSLFTGTVTGSMVEGLVAIDVEGKLTFLNTAAGRMLGRTTDELLGRDIHEAVHPAGTADTTHDPDDCPILRPMRKQWAAEGDDTFVRRDGTPFPVAYTLSPIRAEGRYAGAVLTFNDITERQRLAANLAESEARFRSIAEQSPVLIWRCGADGRRDYHNPTWLDFRGRAAEQEAGDGWIEGVHPDDIDGLLATVREALARREPYEITYRLRRYDGLYRWISERAVPLRDARSEVLGHLGSCLDISERVQFEELLNEQRELAEESSRHKSRLLSALSHDARTPLNAVGLSVQLLEMHLKGEQDVEVQQCIRTIRHAVGNVIDLLTDLLDLSRIDSGAATVAESSFPLQPTLVECLASVEAQARQKGLTCRLDADPAADFLISTDRAKLKQILCNLLSNALKFTDSGNIRLFAHVDEARLSLGVEDSGIGIALGDQPRVFDEFARVETPSRSPGDGTGLGLAICRRLANLLRGEITLQSTPGRGSTFTLVLPADVILGPTNGALETDLTINGTSASSVVEASAEAPAPPTASPAPTSVTILVVEDHLDSRIMLGRLLRRRGYRVVEASNGRDALRLVREERPAMVFMDVNMPVMDGIEATAALRADPVTADLPIYALTGDVTLVNRRRIGEAGVNGYLEKPVTLEGLDQILHGSSSHHPDSPREPEVA